MERKIGNMILFCSDEKRVPFNGDIHPSHVPAALVIRHTTTAAVGKSPHHDTVTTEELSSWKFVAMLLFESQA
jgi:hypothetical protein